MFRFLRKSVNILSLRKRNFHITTNHSDFVPKELSAFLTKLHDNNSKHHQNCMKQRERTHSQNTVAGVEL